MIIIVADNSEEIELLERKRKLLNDEIVLSNFNLQNKQVIGLSRELDAIVIKEMNGQGGARSVYRK